jgi:uncharacterized Zn finger protein
MSDFVPFKCPSCGEALKTVVKPDGHDNFTSVPCHSCGALFTKDDLKGQLREFAIKAAKEAFKKTRF